MKRNKFLKYIYIINIYKYKNNYNYNYINYENVFNNYSYIHILILIYFVGFVSL